MSTREQLHREPSPLALNITPLIDMVFILLIFFAVNASFVKEAGVEIQRPSARTAETRQQANIMIAVTENGEVWVDRQRVDPSSVRTQRTRKVRSSSLPTRHRRPAWSSRCWTRHALPASRALPWRHPRTPDHAVARRKSPDGGTGCHADKHTALQRHPVHGGQSTTSPYRRLGLQGRELHTHAAADS